jgi:serine/threonine-protein phosphatase 2A regulatory subunit A
LLLLPYALQVLERVVPLVDNSVIQATIKPCLTDLAEDTDVDVQFYARQALYACDNVQMQ